jgi:hypothetical protein
VAWMSHLQLAPGRAYGATPFGTAKGCDWAIAVFTTRGILFGGIPRLSPDSPRAPHLALGYTLQGAPSAPWERRRRAVAPLALAHGQESNGEPRASTLQNEVGPQHDEAQRKTWISLALRAAPLVHDLHPLGKRGPLGALEDDSVEKTLMFWNRTAESYIACSRGLPALRKDRFPRSSISGVSLQVAKPETRVHARLSGIENLSLLLGSVLQSMVAHRFVVQWCMQSHDHGKTHIKNRTCNARVDAFVQCALPAGRLSALRRLQACCVFCSEAAVILLDRCHGAKLDLRLSF